MPRSDDDADQQNRPAPEESCPRLAETQFYEAMAAVQRRRLLYYLLENGESTAEELASVLSGWEVTSGGTMYTGAERSAVHLRLLHNHLPRLADEGLIAYDPDTGSVELESVHPWVREIVRQSIEAEQLTPE